MDTDRAQLNSISDLTASIYTLSITTRENVFRSKMKRLREMLSSKILDPSSLERDTLSGTLWFAVLDRDLASVADLLEHSPDANYSRSHINMLWMAIIRGDLEIARMLVDAGADVNARIPEDGPTFLHFLATSDEDDDESLRLAEAMIERGADVDADVGECSVLRTAVTHRAVKFVGLLMKHGARIEGTSLIVLAAKSARAAEMLPIMVGSFEEEMRVEIAFGAMQRMIEEDDTDLDAMKALLKLELPVLDLDIEGWTVLNIAVHYGKVEVVKLLLDHGADVNRKSEDGNFPLYWAASYEDSSMTEFLLNNGANVHQRNDRGRRAIHSACRNSSAANVALLLRSGADVDVVDEDNATPFSLMRGEELSKAQKLMVKRLAILASRAAHVSDGDLEKIREYPKLLAYYDKCLSKLREKC